jgi:hypothetical protein
VEAVMAIFKRHGFAAVAEIGEVVPTGAKPLVIR